MKLENQVRAEEKQANGTKKALVLHVRLLLVTMAFAISLETYFLRELLLFVACAALLCFLPPPKYEHEYSSHSHTLGNTIVFGGSWTLRIPKPTAANN